MLCGLCVFGWMHREHVPKWNSEIKSGFSCDRSHQLTHTAVSDDLNLMPHRIIIIIFCERTIFTPQWTRVSTRVLFTMKEKKNRRRASKHDQIEILMRQQIYFVWKHDIRTRKRAQRYNCWGGDDGKSYYSARTQGMFGFLCPINWIKWRQSWPLLWCVCTTIHVHGHTHTQSQCTHKSIYQTIRPFRYVRRPTQAYLILFKQTHNAHAVPQTRRKSTNIHSKYCVSVKIEMK